VGLLPPFSCEYFPMRRVDVGIDPYEILFWVYAFLFVGRGLAAAVGCVSFFY